MIKIYQIIKYNKLLMFMEQGINQFINNWREESKYLGGENR